MDKPSFISIPDFECLEKKYSGKKLEKEIKKIKNGYPVQYSIGYVDFLDTKILVDKRVLIPRFETELLVYKLRDYIKKYNLEKSNIVDFCSGSGCIGISLKKTFVESNVFCVEKSVGAIINARNNSKINNTKIIFFKKDVLKKLSFKNKFSVLISNPPYVRLDEYVTPNTKYEPYIALYPGSDDILFYKKILDNAKDVLYPKNIIAFEIGSTQAERVCEYAKKIFPNANISVEKDYNNFDRFIFIFNNCE